MKCLGVWSGAAAVIFVLWACAAPSRALAGEAKLKDVRNTSGLAVSLGVGYATGGAPGGQLTYFAEIGNPRLRFGGFVGMGLSEGLRGDDADSPADRLGFAAGAFGSFGRGTHRLYFDVSAALGWSGLSDAFFQRTWAVLGGAGWEVATRRGFLMRVTLAAGPRFVWGPLWSPLDRLAVDGVLSLGWKLW